MADDDSLQKLRDSIQAFERARASRQRIGATAPAAKPPSVTTRRRWLPVVMLGVGLCTLAIVLIGGGPTESVSDGAARVPAVANASSPSSPTTEPGPNAAPTVVTDPAAESIAAPRPVAPGGSADSDLQDQAAGSIAAPTPAPSSGRTSPEDAQDASAETALPDTAATPPASEATGGPGAVSAERENGSREEAGSAVGSARPGRFSIQVGAYDREPQATALATRLAEKNYPAYVAESRDLEDRTVYRVRVGGYTERSAAEETGRRITSDEGLDWYLLQTP